MDELAHTFRYAIGQTIRIDVSAEVGEVIGRAEFDRSDDQYLVRYRAADGRATEQWWTESALSPTINS